MNKKIGIKMQNEIKANVLIFFFARRMAEKEDLNLLKIFIKFLKNKKTKEDLRLALQSALNKEDKSYFLKKLIFLVESLFFNDTGFFTNPSYHFKENSFYFPQAYGSFFWVKEYGGAYIPIHSEEDEDEDFDEEENYKVGAADIACSEASNWLRWRIEEILIKN